MPRPAAQPVATVVLDNEAAQALADRYHPKHRTALAYLEAAAVRNGRRPGSHRVVVPVVVRVEAALDRRAPTAALFNRLRVADVPLDGPRADRAAALRRTGSVTDACVAEAALAVAPEPATVLTSDLSDLPTLVAGTSHVVVRAL